jgi:1-deoxy-D-xylulose-5-phosphate synthase
MRAFPDRCLDVGIAEQHAVTLAAGMAAAGFTPFCVIYATFLQRALDQVMHDVALQNLGVVFCIDRAGLVGHDGATHHGLYDLPFLRSLPNMTLLAPRDELQLRQQLYTLSQQPPAGPVAIRYPRGYGVLADWELPFEEVSLTQGTCLRAGNELAILSVGTLATPVAEACNVLERHALAHYDLGCIKPLDANLLHHVFSAHKKILVVEENCLVGGAGSAVLEWANSHGYTQTITLLGIPDVYVGHGATQVIKQNMGLTTTALIDKIRTLLTR